MFVTSYVVSVSPRTEQCNASASRLHAMLARVIEMLPTRRRDALRDLALFVCDGG
jgi:hypothetical protein